MKRDFDIQDIEAKRAENRNKFYGVHSIPTKGKFRLNPYRNDGRQKGIKTEAMKTHIPRSEQEKKQVQEYMEKLRERIKQREEPKC